MTTSQSPRPDAPRPEPGYRGSLPALGDRLARPWIFTVIGIFVLVIVLSILGIPSRFTPDPTPLPSAPTTSVEPSASESASASPSAEESASAASSESPSASAKPSSSPSP